MRRELPFPRPATDLPPWPPDPAVEAQDPSLPRLYLGCPASTLGAPRGRRESSRKLRRGPRRRSDELRLTPPPQVSGSSPPSTTSWSRSPPSRSSCAWRTTVSVPGARSTTVAAGSGRGGTGSALSGTVVPGRGPSPRCLPTNAMGPTPPPTQRGRGCSAASSRYWAGELEGASPRLTGDFRSVLGPCRGTRARRGQPGH